MDRYQNAQCITKLYWAIRGIGTNIFRDEYVDKACYELNRPWPVSVKRLPSWDKAECVALMTSRTRLPAKTRECLIDTADYDHY